MMKSMLKFRDNRTFKIVQFTDVHWRNGEAEDLSSEALMERILQAEQPDFVVFTGDLLDSGYCQNPLESIRNAVAAVDRSKVPWAAVFGNHDSEGEASRESLMEVLTSFSNCMSQAGPSEVSGVGNFVLNVYSSQETDKCAAALFFLDSGSYAPENIGGYDWIHTDQIAWYKQQSDRLSAETGHSTVPLPSLAFFHIPLHEYQEVWEQGECMGNKQENVCASRVNSGLFTAMLEQGDVMGTFVGHDHLNDYIGELHGIRLAYGRATGFNTYGKEDFPRGARVILLQEGKRHFETWIRLDSEVGFGEASETYRSHSQLDITHSQSNTEHSQL
jgi:hypothetical protein